MGKGIIGIDGSKLSDSQKTGVEKTVFYIVKNLLDLNKNKYLLYSLSSLRDNPDFKGAKERVVSGKHCWHRFYLPLALFKDRPEKFLSISNTLPVFAPKKSVQLLHDFAFCLFPEAYSKKELFLQRETIRVTLKKAACIIFTLEANRQDFIRFFGKTSIKTAVVPLAFNDKLYHWIKNPRDVLGLKREYILFVGRLEEKKNVERIVRSFDLFKQRSPSDLKLVLAGKPGYGFSRIKAAIRKAKYGKDVVIPGYVKEKDLPHLYAGARVFFFPSLYEGFGIPILEAMATGTPVITSNISTIKEVAEDAAIFIEPKNVDQMAKALDNLINNKNLCQELVLKGFAQSEKFSWQKTAKQINNIMTNL